MAVVDTQIIFDAVYANGIDIRQQGKYDFFKNVVGKTWDQYESNDTTDLLSENRARTLMIEMYDYYNAQEDYFDALGESEKRTQFMTFAKDKLGL